ncbi:bifunctional glycosyltransferase/class I SAM-dependent methyltransferase [Solidesulfovibrio sp.]
MLSHTAGASCGEAACLTGAGADCRAPAACRDRAGLLLVVVESASTILFDRITQEAVRLQTELKRPLVLLRLLDNAAAVAPQTQHIAPGVAQVTVACAKGLDYGQKVKLGFQYALTRNMDTVVILDGGMRYPMRMVKALVRPIDQGQADMVLAVPGRKRPGEGPAAAFAEQFAPRFVSRLISALMRVRLRGWHCGFRAYRVAALREIPFGINADDRMFNTEVIIQFLLSNRPITEIAAPQYRHQGLGLRAKLHFALGMFQASALSSLHRLCIFYQRKFDIQNPAETYGLKLGYRSSHTLTFERVRPGSRVLDIGCGNSAFARLLREKQCQVSGIDQHDQSICQDIDHYMQLDLDVKSHDFDTAGFDYILLLDIVEHLRFPEALLDHIRETSGVDKPTVLISVPNVAFFIIRLRLLFGSFQYGKLGILDITHTRLFTEGAIRALLEQCGFTIHSVAGIPAPYPKAVGYNALSRLLLQLNTALIALRRPLFSYQIFIEATPKPTLSDLIGDVGPCSPSQS